MFLIRLFPICEYPAAFGAAVRMYVINFGAEFATRDMSEDSEDRSDEMMEERPDLSLAFA